MFHLLPPPFPSPSYSSPLPCFHSAPKAHSLLRSQNDLFHIQIRSCNPFALNIPGASYKNPNPVPCLTKPYIIWPLPASLMSHTTFSIIHSLPVTPYGLHRLSILLESGVVFPLNIQCCSFLQKGLHVHIVILPFIIDFTRSYGVM